MSKILTWLLVVVAIAAVIVAANLLLPPKYADNFLVKGALVGVIVVIVLKLSRSMG